MESQLLAPLVQDSSPSTAQSRTFTKELITTPDQFINLYLELDKQTLFAYDTETNGQFDRFKIEIVGLSLAFGDKAYYIPLNHHEGDQLTATYVLDKLRTNFENELVAKVAHNSKFDEMVLSRYGIKVKGPGHDTLTMAWLLGAGRGEKGLKYLAKKYLGVDMETYQDVIATAPKVKNVDRDYNFARVSLENALSYAADDAHYALQLYEIFAERLKSEGVSQAYEHVERPFVRTLGNMEDYGARMDIDAIDYADKRLPEIFQEVEASIYEQAGEVFNIGSPPQLGQILFGKLGIGNNVPKTKSGNYTTDKKTLERYKDSHKIVADVLRRKKISKTHSTFVRSLKESIAKDGRIHPSFNGTGTVTGRLSCNSPNLQNVETDEVEEIKIRDFFIPSDGYKFVVADYSQVELRIMAHLSRDEFMINAFLSGHDFHEETANKMAKIMGEDVARAKAKPLNFGIGYGRTEYSVAETLGCSMEKAKEFIDAWFATFPQVEAYRNKVIARARKEGFVRTMTGRKRDLMPGIQANANFVRQRSERQAFNTKIQGSAADIIKMAMIALEPELEYWDAHMCIQIHDELVIEAPEEKAYSVAEQVKSIMEKPFQGKNPLCLPLVAEPKVVDKWGDAKD